MMVKICGLKTAADVAAAAAAGANAVGFVFVDSPRKVGVAEALAACQSIPSGISRVAVMKQPTQQLVDEVLEGFKPDVLQTDVEDFDGLSLPEDLACWPVFRQGGEEPTSTVASAFVYEGRASGTGETIDWNVAATHAETGKMILAGGLDAGNVEEAIRVAKPWGVDVSSGVERERGRKDSDKILKFVEAARAATRKS